MKPDKPDRRDEPERLKRPDRPKRLNRRKRPNCSGPDPCGNFNKLKIRNKNG